MQDQTPTSRGPHVTGSDTLGLPDTPAGKHLSAYLAAFNTGNAAAMRHFVADHYASSALAQRSVEQRVSSDAMTYHFTRGLAVRHIETSTDQMIEVLLQARLDASWARLRLAVTGQPPHGVTAIDLSPAAASSGRWSPGRGARAGDGA